MNKSDSFQRNDFVKPRSGSTNLVLRKSQVSKFQIYNSLDVLNSIGSIHNVKVHDQMVVLFASLLLKLNRLKDCFTVLNTYGRKCLQNDKLTRANMYKLLAMATLETKTEGYTVKALKHLEKALEKYTFLNSKEGIATCLLLKLHILQIIKYAEDPLDSDCDDADELSADSKISFKKQSKINNTFGLFYKAIKWWEDILDKSRIRLITEYVKRCQKEESIISFTENESILKFIFRPILSVRGNFKDNNSSLKSNKSHSEPKIDCKFFINLFHNIFYSD